MYIFYTCCRALVGLFKEQMITSGDKNNSNVTQVFK